MLQAKVDDRCVGQEEADRAVLEPLTVVGLALEAEAPRLVNSVGKTLDQRPPRLTTTTANAVGGTPRSTLNCGGWCGTRCPPA